MGGKYTTMCDHNECGICTFYSRGSYAAVCGRGERSHGVEHGISDLCQGQPRGPSNDGGTGVGFLSDKEVICVEEGQLVV